MAHFCPTYLYELAALHTINQLDFTGTRTQKAGLAILYIDSH